MWVRACVRACVCVHVCVCVCVRERVEDVCIYVCFITHECVSFAGISAVDNNFIKYHVHKCFCDNT